MTKKGIDVSEHQGKINWDNIKTDFAILRAGYGREYSQKDKQFDNNYKGCKDNNIPCGAYWYSYAVTPQDARREAETCLKIIKGKTFEYPIYFDIEERRQLALGKTACTAIAKAFLEVVEKAGYWVGIYSSKSHLENYLSEEICKRYAVWVAHYGVGKTTYRGQFGIWQRSSTGAVAGISGYVDINECYIDYPALIKNAGLNGYAAGNRVQHTEYTVKTGDSLWAIAAKFLGSGARYKEIMELNSMTSDVIYSGQVLKIPNT